VTAPVTGWQTGPVTESAEVVLRPRRIRYVAWGAAAALVAVFTAVATALTGPTGAGTAVFQRGDQLAMTGLGVLGALAVLTTTRPRVWADAEGIRVRNIVGGYQLPWSAVRAVRLDRGSSWASLELVTDDVVAVMAVQVVDKEYAVAGLRALRALHASATAPTA